MSWTKLFQCHRDREKMKIVFPIYCEIFGFSFCLWLCVYSSHSPCSSKSGQRPLDLCYEKFYVRIFKTSVLYLQFEMTFQQQQHRVEFLLLYSDLGGRWDVFFLPEVVAQIWLDPLRVFEVVEQLLLLLFFFKKLPPPSCF